MQSTAAIEFENVDNDRTFGYSLIKIIGKLTTYTDGVSKIFIVQTENSSNKSEYDYDISSQSKSFKALVLLRKGWNNLKFFYNNNFLTELNLNYDPKMINADYNICSHTKVVVRGIFYTCQEDLENLTFKAPYGIDNSKESAKKRLQLGMLLMQTFCAEEMLKHGYGHRTFGIEVDPNEPHLPYIRFIKSSMKKEEFFELGNKWTDGGHAGNSFIHKEVTSDPDYNGLSKNMVLMLDTTYENKHLYAHTALGGGVLGLFSSIGLYTWATSLKDLKFCWNNTTKIDQENFKDDSCCRQEYWANYATQLGAAMHEMGHCFDLPHTDYGIMSRGFDNFNRFFMMTEPHLKDELHDYTHSAGAVWHPSSMQILKEKYYFVKASDFIHEKWGWTETTYFSKISNKFWVEIAQQEVEFKFKEIYNNSGELIILDESRNLFIKILSDCCYFGVNDCNQCVNLLYYGKFLDTKTKGINQLSNVLKKWTYGEGKSFNKISDTKWVEMCGKKCIFEFEEVSCDSSNTILFDKSRNIYAKLTESQCFWGLENQNNIKNFIFWGKFE
jgi:hypothetical protein